jgi:hypothetical protein
VLGELCLIRLTPEIVRLEICEAAGAELEERFVALDNLPEELEIALEELDILFVELEGLLVELEVFFVEVDALRLDSETLVDELTTFLVELGTSLPEVRAILVATDGFMLELDTFLPELESLFVELELFRMELDGILVALDGFLEELESAFVEVDACFTELGVPLLALLELELAVFLVELEDVELVSSEPRVDFVSCDELETLLDGLTLCTEGTVCFELEKPLLGVGPFVDVVDSWEVVFLLVQTGDPSVTEIFLLELVFRVDVLTILPLLVNLAVLLLFDELLLNDFSVGRDDVDNARRGNMIFLEVGGPGGDDWSFKGDSPAVWST